MDALKRSLGTLKKLKRKLIYIFFDFKGKFNVAATAELLRTNNCISSNDFLLFDEVYLKICKEYFEESHLAQMKQEINTRV